MDKKKKPQPPPVPPPIPYLINHKLQIHKEKPICLLAHPSNNPHYLTISKTSCKTESDCFSCRGQHLTLIREHSMFFHYYCTTCDVDFHNGCHKFPRKVTHPYHLQHPLTFSFRNFETGIISDAYSHVESFLGANLYDTSCTSSGSNKSDPNKSGTIEISWSQSVDKCTWCGNTIHGNLFYRCSICNFCLDLSCFENIPLLIIENPKSHHHSLVLYPRPLLTPCDACGMVNVLEPSYVCFQCNYMVHQSCIDLPRVIKITRHRHRLCLVPYLQRLTSLCRICYKTVDGKYGQYSCNHDDCSYVVHSKCATDENVWDGKELEWEPEDSDDTEDIAPFKIVGHDLIKYFSHEHHLKLEKYDGLRDAEKQCQACILPINSQNFYKCIQCDFFLHEECASLFRKLDHALHIHTLVLDPSQEDSPEKFYNKIGCSVCSRKFSGFRYKCSKKDCVLPKGFQIDVRCILVPDYFTHKSHEHPLFINTSHKDKNKICCKGCKEVCLQSYLQCSMYEFALCYKCTTIPNEVSYKYDKHPLSLCYGERAQGMYWCEVCEKEINPRDWFYACNDCCVTTHVQCIFGSSIYMKPGFMFKYSLPKWTNLSTKLKVIRNGNSTRPLCINCGHFCPSSVYYKSHGYRKVTLCSLNCLVERMGDAKQNIA